MNNARGGKERSIRLPSACRDARLNAKIDSAAGTVVMGTSFQTAYEQNLENAKALSSRTFLLANAVGAASRA